MYYDPGNIDGRDWCFTSKVNPSPDIPWGVYRGGSLYRVDNLEIREKKNLDIVRYMNKRFDDRATVVMCGTQCLMGINKFSAFLGYPMDFPEYIEGKKPGSIGHVTTGVDGVTPDRVREIMKGSCTIKREFNKINFMRTSIVGKPHIPKPQMMKWLNNTGMVVNTYTSWDSGFGRGSLEGCAHSCLGMSKNSEFAEKINSPIVNLLSSDDIVDKARYYHDNPDEFEVVRRRQYDWAKRNFSMNAVAERFRMILEATISETRNKRYYHIS